MLKRDSLTPPEGRKPDEVRETGKDSLVNTQEPQHGQKEKEKESPDADKEVRLRASKDGSKGSKQGKPQSLADLIRAIYTRKRLSLNLSQSDKRLIRSRPKLEPEECDRLLQLAISDKTLERTRELMLLIMEFSDTPSVAKQLHEFSRNVLRRHPAFSSRSLAEILGNHPDGGNEDYAVRALTSQNFTSLPWPEETAALKKKKSQQCQVNALYCFLLWLKENKGVSLEWILSQLQSRVWGPLTRHHRTDSAILKALMNTLDTTGVAVMFSVLERKVADCNQQMEDARIAQEQAANRAKDLEAHLNRLMKQLDTAKDQLEVLSENIVNTKRSHENEMAHMRNDHETLKGRVLRCLREELLLLDDGLQALRRDPPKVHVMLDHAERVIDGLKREVNRIKGDN